MKNTATITGVGLTAIYSPVKKVYFIADVEYVDIVAGDTVNITTNSGLFNGNYRVILINRGQLSAVKIVIEDTSSEPWRLIEAAKANPNDTGTMTVIAKTPNRPKFWRYYDEYITPLYSAVYDSVFKWVDGRTTFSGLIDDAQFPPADYEILSDSGKYSGVHKADLLADGNTNRQRYIFSDIPFNGTDSGILVYTQTAVPDPINLLASANYTSPVIDTTQPVQTVVNPTDKPIVVNSISSNGTVYTQTVGPGEVQAVAAPVEKTPDPPFVVDPIVTTQNQLKSATMIQPPINTDTPVNVVDTSVKSSSVDYKPQIDAKMEEIKANTTFITLIRNSYKNSSFGYTQAIATNAVKELKAAGIIPLNWQVPLTWDGDAWWGQAAWVQANYPYDEYVAPVNSSNPPVIDSTNPNPGATPTTNPNPGNKTDIPVTTNVIPVTSTTQQSTTQQQNNTATNSGTSATSDVEKEGINPIIKLILVVLGIVLIVKLLKK